MRASFASVLTGLAITTIAALSSAQSEPPPPASPMPANPPPGYGQQLPPGYGQAPPGYGQPTYNGDQAPPDRSWRPIEPLPPERPEPPKCCTLSIRMNPFDLVYSKLSFEGEYAVAGPISIEVAPSYIFGVPDAGDGSFTGKGFGIDGKLGYYFGGHALRGFFLKAVARYEAYSLTGNDPAFKLSFNETTFGGLIGSQTVFGHDGGFTLTGGIGVGYTINAKDYEFQVDTAPADQGPCNVNEAQPVFRTRCISRAKVNLLGQISLGYTF